MQCPHAAIMITDGYSSASCTEPVFVDLLRSPGIDSQPGGPVRQPFLSYRSARLHRLTRITNADSEDGKKEKEPSRAVRNEVIKK
jgi:hypothetical protein